MFGFVCKLILTHFLQIWIFFFYFLSSHLWDRPPCNPRRASTRTPKTAKAVFGGVAVSAIISPLPRQKAPPRQGHTERNCRLNMGIVCSAGFAVAIVYERMLVCSRAGVWVAIVSAVI